MKDDPTHEKQVNPSNEQRPYRKPELVEFGSVRDLTRGNSGPRIDFATPTRA